MLNMSRPDDRVGEDKLISYGSCYVADTGIVWKREGEINGLRKRRSWPVNETVNYLFHTELDGKKKIEIWSDGHFKIEFEFL